MDGAGVWLAMEKRFPGGLKKNVGDYRYCKQEGQHRFGCCRAEVPGGFCMNWVAESYAGLLDAHKSRRRLRLVMFKGRRSNYFANC